MSEQTEFQSETVTIRKDAIPDKVSAWVRANYSDLKQKDPDRYFELMGMLYAAITDIAEGRQ